ncbi:TetR/AcrR family transcriptional regulator [Roseibium sp. SCPC15]|uniref:TetR/AcrR family transcriptional regulator n=1 Tax=Roseibium sp. SCP15 TaxID=3141376 RepID=UPI0033392502
MLTKKEDILSASLTVFQEEGLKGARMERIAQVAGVSKRTLYKHFESKDALFEAICAMVIEILSSMEIADYDPDAAIDVQLEEALRSYIRQTMTPEFLNCSRVILAEFMRNPTAASEFYDAYRSIDAPLARLVSSAMTAGKLRSSEPVAATNLLLSLFKNVIQVPTILNLTRAPTQSEIDTVVEKSVRVFVSEYG